MWIAEADGEQVGQIELNFPGEGALRIAFAMNLVVSLGRPEVASMLIQRAIKESKSRGFARTSFTIDPTQTDLMKLILDGKARVDLIWASVEN